MKKTNDFGRDSIPLLVLKISVPFMFAQLVGNIPVTGADALAGVGVCAPIVTLLSSFGTLFGIGGSVLFSVRMGAGDEKNARKILANSFSYLIVVSLALTLIFLLTKEQLLNWFGASDVTFGRDIFCAFIHGDELFYHGAGVPAPRDDDHPDRRGHQHYP